MLRALWYRIVRRVPVQSPTPQLCCPDILAIWGQCRQSEISLRNLPLSADRGEDLMVAAGFLILQLIWTSRLLYAARSG